MNEPASPRTRGESPEGLPGSAIGLSILIAAIWGFNFIVIKVGVASVPPLMLVALRFVFSALPAVFFVRRPPAAMRLVAAYGLLLGVGEFGLLFTAIKLGAPAGLSSIALQFQVYFTALLAALVLKERLAPHAVWGMVIAAAGLASFAFSAGGGEPGAGGGASTMSLPLLAMILLAALGWAGANVTTKYMPGTGALSLMAWSSLFSPLPLAALSLIFEGPKAVAAAISGLGLVAIGALIYLVALSTLVGYGLWNHLIMRHGAARIAPFSLMVPIFAVVFAASILGERFRPLDAAGAGLVLVGLALHIFGDRLGAGRRPRQDAR